MVDISKRVPGSKEWSDLHGPVKQLAVEASRLKNLKDRVSNLQVLEYITTLY